MIEPEAALESEWGPAATHSDYRIGDFIAYQIGNQESRTGRIIFACAPVNRELPLRFIVEPSDMARGGMPDVVWMIDIQEIIG